ncbi:toprim domain-containing protein [Chelatococcus sp. GCM10030263]|uniref:DUF7146 domain-containing protein n=1 Tax=Chelatococcus sp. GCM10030263 TaxID=3273387 RepID=UPI0036112AE3
MTRPSLKERARGKWMGILPHLGVSPQFLTKKHGPCPMCGGKDRFRFDNKDGRGTFICSHCGAGDGADLVMKVNGCDFRQAADKIEALLGDIPAEEPSKPRDAEADRSAKIRLWKSSSPISAGDHVDRYLASRGIALQTFPSCLRSIDEMAYTDADDKRTMHPGMIAVVSGLNPEEQGTLHRTYLTLDGRKAHVPQPRKLMPGHFPSGGAIRLAEHGDTLGIAEGIETALSASILFNVPCWAAVDASRLAAWQPPEGVTHVIVFGDHDVSFTGQDVSYTLARRLKVKNYNVTVEIPKEMGTDWNDVLCTERAAA